MLKHYFFPLLVLIAFSTCFSLNNDQLAKLKMTTPEHFISQRGGSMAYKHDFQMPIGDSETLEQNRPREGKMILDVVETFFRTIVTPMQFLGFLYGLALLCYGASFSNQIHLITLMRVTGYQRLKTAATTIKDNYSRAREAFHKELPSLLLAKQAVKHYQEKLKEMSDASKKAKKDGNLTKKELKNVELLRAKQSEALKEDIANIKTATSSVKTILQTISFKEVRDIIGSLAHWMCIVLASGHQNSWIAVAIGLGCHAVNIGNMLTDVTTRLHYPIVSRLPISRASIANYLSLGLMTALGFFLMIKTTKIGYRVNSSLIGATLIIFSLEKILATIKFPFRQRILALLRGPFGGTVIFVLAVVGILCRYHFETHPKLSSFTEHYVFIPLHWLDAVVDELIQIADVLDK